MPCNRCGSNDLWDDNLWWGCNQCGYAAGPDGPTFIFAKDKPGLARSTNEMVRQGRIRNTNDYYAATESEQARTELEVRASIRAEADAAEAAKPRSFPRIGIPTRRR